jgi:hypothetical protein
VKIKIAVVVNADGHWAAFGDDTTTLDVAEREAASNVPDNCRSATYFIEAEVPIPESKVISGTVTE